jgi:hypothetical protein
MTSYLKKDLSAPLRYNCHWETRDELHFLSLLGRHELSVTTPRRVLLANYLKAAHQRDDWGTLDQDRCVEVATAMLRKENA